MPYLLFTSYQINLDKISLPLQMAECLRRVQPVTVANHVKAHQSLIERAVTWLATESSWAQVNVPPFAVVSFAKASLFSSSAAPVVSYPVLGLSGHVKTAHTRPTLVLFLDEHDSFLRVSAMALINNTHRQLFKLSVTSNTTQVR